MQDKLTPRQVRAWSLCALSVPAAMALPGCGWLWVLGGSILACALAACQQAMQRQSGLYLARMDALDADGCVEFLQAHPGAVTLADAHAALLRGEALDPAILLPGENGGIILAG